jgi:threonine synthase
MSTGTTHAIIVGADTVICASTGNTSSSMAAYASYVGLKATVLIGEEKIAKGKLAQTLEYSPKVVQIAGGDFDDAMNYIQMIKGKYLLNSPNAYRLEGQKTIPIRLLEGLNWQVPDFIVYPGGNLANSSTAEKAFTELYEFGLIDKMPRLVIVNAAGANTLDVLVNEKGLRWNNGNVDRALIQQYYDWIDREKIKAQTEASAIEILRPVNLEKALRALQVTNGIVTSVSDEQIFDAKAMLGRSGIGCEPASAATVAGTKKLVEEGVIDKDATVAVILTGHQLKDPDASVRYHLNSDSRYGNRPVLVENDLEAVLANI